MAGTLQVYGHITGKLSGIGHITGELSVPDSVDGTRPYEGDYTVTPQPYEQVFPTRGKRMVHDLTVEAIPNNYGLITWNGSALTVS